MMMQKLDNDYQFFDFGDDVEFDQTEKCLISSRFMWWS